MRSLFLTFLLFSNLCIYSQNIIVSGEITDKSTGETLAGANIYALVGKQGTTSNDNAYFRLSLLQNDVLIIRFLGYKNDTLIISKSGFYMIALIPQDINIKEIEVKAVQNNDDFIHAKLNIPFSKLKEIPAIGGEKDPIRLFSALPGIASAKEGMSAMTVRGGNTDQNLFVLEGATLYNTGHLYNFISVFNPYIIKKIDFYKDGFPAQYGGRLSSVMDISLKDGNRQSKKIGIDIGLISSNIVVEGPVNKKHKTSYIFAIRSTYVDLFNLRKASIIRNRGLSDLVANSVLSAENTFTGYTFADLNAKITHYFNERNKISISLYKGIDWYRNYAAPYVQVDKLIEYNILSNSLVNLKTTHLLFNRLSLQFNASYTANKSSYFSWYDKYDKTTTIKDSVVTDNYYLAEKSKTSEKNNLNDLSLKTKATFSLNNHNSIMGGFDYIFHRYDLFRYKQSGEYRQISFQTEYFTPLLYAHEVGIYVAENFSYHKLYANWGFRQSFFRQQKTIYSRPEPRINISLKSSENTLFRASFARMYQYNHSLIRNEPMVDKINWVPSTKSIPPEESTLYSISWQQKLDRFLVTSSMYYKQLEQLVHYVYQNIDRFYYSNWQNRIYTGGKGNSKGFEFQIEKTKGDFTANLNYTLSWTNRRFFDLNNGKAFPFIYDRRHIINFFANYRLNKHWHLGALFTASSGRRINFPNAFISQNPLIGYDFFVYSDLNSYQLPFYHRLDLNAQWSKVLENNRLFTISINVYNAYFHKNAYTLFIDRVPQLDADGNIISYKTSVKTKTLLPFLPTVNIKYEF